MKKRYVKILFILFIILFFFGNYSQAMLIVLDPGHGGIDPGAINGDMQEKELNLKTAQYLREYLGKYDAEVVLTHEGFSGYEISVYDRAMVARNRKADLLVSMHYNSGSGGRGAEVWVSANTSLDKYNKETSLLGNKILANLSNLGLENRGVKTNFVSDETDIYSDGTRADYYGIIRYAMRGTKIDYGVVSPAGAIHANIQKGEGIPTILVEHCFINTDSQYIDSDEEIRKIAEADGKAIVEHYGLRKKEEVVESVKLDKNELFMLPGETKKLTANVLPETAINKDVTWESSNPEIITVDEQGNVTAKEAGQAIITVKSKDKGKTATCIAYVQGISLNQTSIKMFDFDQKQIVASLVYENASHKLLWKSEDDGIVTVTQEGFVTGVAEGKTNIIVEIEGTNIKKTIPVEIVSLGEDVKINIKEIKEENGVLTKITPKSSLNNFKKYFELSDGLTLKIETNNQYIGTGTKILVIHEASDLVVKEYTCIIFGDVNGDGEIKASDYVLIKNHIMGTRKLEENQVLAADVKKDEQVKASDYVLIKNYIMKGNSIRTE